MDLNYINIIGTIKDNSTNKTVAEASQIYDNVLDKKLSEINDYIYQKILSKEKCLGFFATSSLLPSENVQVGDWAIIPGSDGLYIWSYDGSTWGQTSGQYSTLEIDISGLSAVATTGSYTDLINKPTNISSFTNDAGYITQQDISDKVDAADLATVATTGSYNDLSNKPTILTINDIDSRVGAILNSSEDAVAALRELINELESTDGATVAGILSSLDAINQDVSGLNTRLDTAESNIQQIIDNQSTPTVNVPKHIIIEQGQYDENNYEQDAIYFILSSASTAWTFGGNFPISLT